MMVNFLAGDHRLRISAKQLGLIAFLPVLLVMLNFALAHDYFFDVEVQLQDWDVLLNITNATELYNTTFDWNVSIVAPVNQSFECNFSFGNESTDEVIWAMINSTNASTTNDGKNDTNATFFITPELAIEYSADNSLYDTRDDDTSTAWRNITFWCNDTLGTGNLSYYNTSATGMFFFRINERPVDTTTLNISGITNATTVDADGQDPNIYVTLNGSLSVCNIHYWDGNHTGDTAHIDGGAILNMSNLTNRTTYTNASVLSDIFNDTLYGQIANLTIRCEDAWGNKSDYNGTTVQGRYATSRIFFDYDPNTPWVSWKEYGQNFTVLHNSSSDIYGDEAYINVTFWVNETNFDSCGVYVYNESADRISLQGANVSMSEEDGMGYTNCSVLIYPQNITGGNTSSASDGDFIITPWANDTAGHSNVSETNMTGLINVLPATKWTYVVYSGENITIRDFVNNFSLVSSVSYFNNTYWSKNYTTYVNSTPTINNDTNIQTGDALALYTAHTTWYMRANYITDPDFLLSSPDAKDNGLGNMTLYAGITNCNLTNLSTTVNRSYWQYNDSMESIGHCNYSAGNKTAVNLMSIYEDMTMNDTLYACWGVDADGNMSDTCFNATEGKEYVINVSSNETQIDYASYYNASSGNYVTCKYGWDFCTGCTEVEYAWNCTPQTINLKKAIPIFVIPSGNFTINRTNIVTKEDTFTLS